MLLTFGFAGIIHKQNPTDLRQPSVNAAACVDIQTDSSTLIDMCRQHQYPMQDSGCSDAVTAMSKVSMAHLLPRLDLKALLAWPVGLHTDAQTHA